MENISTELFDTSKGKLLELKYGEIDLKLYVDMSVGIGGDKWPAADMFCQMLIFSRWKDFFQNLFRQKSVLELGSGTGLNSILIEKLFASTEINVTDLKSHVPIIQHNISINCESSSIIYASELDWFHLPTEPKKYDIILAFECVYNEELYLPFLDTLDKFSTDQTVIILGLTRLFAKPLFFSLMRKKGFAFTLLPRGAMPLEYANSTTNRDVGLFVVKKRASLP